MARTNPRFYSDKIHRQIVLDLAIKTLIVDQQKIENFKSHFAMTALFENSIQKLQKDLREVKAELGKLGIKIEPTPKKQDDLFVIYTAFSDGQKETFTYSSIALRNWTNEEIKRVFGLEYGEPKRNKE